MIFVLVMFRLTALARTQAVNASRELALRNFSERLVAASERSDVWNAAVDAIVALGAAGVIGCVVTDAGTSEEAIVAATWPDVIGDRVRVNAVEADGDAAFHPLRRRRIDRRHLTSDDLDPARLGGERVRAREVAART